MSDADAQLLSAMAEIWRDRRPDTQERLRLIEDAVTDALEGTLDADGQTAAARAAHALSGSAGTFGYLAASAHARELETALKAGPLAAPDLPRIAGLVVDLRTELDRTVVPPAPAQDPAPAAPADAGDPAPVDVAPAPARDAAELLVVGGPAGRAARLADEATGRGLRAASADRVGDARDLLQPGGPAFVLVHLDAPEGPAAALELVDLAAGSATVVAILDGAEEIDRLAIAQAGARAVVPAGRDVPGTIDAVLELRERLRTKGTRVLAIDDDPALLDAVRLVLRGVDLDVVTSDGQESLWVLLERHEPDLLLLDIDLPWGHSGIDLCRAVRADPVHGALPVVVLSARTDPDTVLEVFQAGADDYVTKPFVGPELVVRIGNRLERARLLRELSERDALTGLPGPARAIELLEELHERAVHDGQPFCVAYVDSDDVQGLNLRHGYAAGDAALRATADVLRRTFRGDDVVARWRGDEFVVAMAGITQHDARERLARALEAVRDGGAVVPGDSAPRSLSVGLAVAGPDGDDVPGLLHAAELASRAAAAEGGGRILVAVRAADVAVTDVVVVEDDPALVALLLHALGARGYSVRHVGDGVEASALLGGGTPGLASRVVLLDWDLPGVDGMAVLRSMREAGVLERTKVIMLTARASEAEILRALETGASDHVAKPFSVPVLLQRVRRALGE